jgi:ADP-heptose:LPS heptosyltransferase
LAHELDFKNILVIHFGQLGDVILGLPALKAIRERFAASKITLLHGKPPTAIVKLANVADEYIPVDRVALRDGNKLKSIAEMLRLARNMRQRKFDLVIDLHSLSETNILGFAAGIKSRLYAHRKGRSMQRLANFPISPPVEDRTRHASLRYMDVIRPLGIAVEPRLSLNAKDEDISSWLECL